MCPKSVTTHKLNFENTLYITTWDVHATRTKLCALEISSFYYEYHHYYYSTNHKDKNSRVWLQDEYWVICK